MVKIVKFSILNFQCSIIDGRSSNNGLPYKCPALAHTRQLKVFKIWLKHRLNKHLKQKGNEKKFELRMLRIYGKRCHEKMRYKGVTQPEPNKDLLFVPKK